MELRKVNPLTIKIPEVRVTSRMSPETLEIFRKSYRAMGNVTPILCCEIDGALWLVDGKHRLDEVIDQRITELEVVVEQGTMSDVLCQNLLLDHLRGKHPVSEMVALVEHLWRKEGMDSDAISRKTGLRRERVENYQLLSTLTPYCREELDQDKISVGVGLQLVRIEDPGKQELMLSWYHMYGWDVPTLRAAIDEYLRALKSPPAPPAPPGPPEPITITCAYCHESYPVEEIANPATCRSCYGILIEAQALARQQAAEQRAAEPPPTPSPANGDDVHAPPEGGA